MFEKFKELIDYVRSHQFLLLPAFEIGFITIIGLLILWSYVLRTPVIQLIYGSQDDEPYQISNNMISQNFVNIKTLQSSTIHGIDIDFKMNFKKKITVTARALNIQHYGFWGTYVRGRRGNAGYDHTAPYDLTFSYGSAGSEENYKLIDVKSAYRYLELRVGGKWNGSFDEHEIKNYMTIASGKNIEKGLSLIKPGDSIRIEGYVISIATNDGIERDVTTGVQSRTTNQGTYEIRNGSSVFKKETEVLYLTKLSFNNVVFK